MTQTEQQVGAVASGRSGRVGFGDSPALVVPVSAGHLEARAVHAARLHANWRAARPRATRAIEFTLDRQPDNSHGLPPQVDQVLFLPGRNGEFLVSCAGGHINAWEVPLDGSVAYRVAEWAWRHVNQVLVNQDPGHELELVARTWEPAEWVVTLLRS